MAPLLQLSYDMLIVLLLHPCETCSLVRILLFFFLKIKKNKIKNKIKNKKNKKFLFQGSE